MQPGRIGRKLQAGLAPRREGWRGPGLGVAGDGEGEVVTGEEAAAQQAAEPTAHRYRNTAADTVADTQIHSHTATPTRGVARYPRFAGERRPPPPPPPPPPPARKSGGIQAGRRLASAAGVLVLGFGALAFALPALSPPPPSPPLPPARPLTPLSRRGTGPRGPLPPSPPPPPPVHAGQTRRANRPPPAARRRAAHRGMEARQEHAKPRDPAMRRGASRDGGPCGIDAGTGPRRARSPQIRPGRGV